MLLDGPTPGSLYHDVMHDSKSQDLYSKPFSMSVTSSGPSGMI